MIFFRNQCLSGRLRYEGIQASIKECQHLLLLARLEATSGHDTRSPEGGARRSVSVLRNRLARSRPELRGAHRAQSVQRAPVLGSTTSSSATWLDLVDAPIVRGGRTDRHRAADGRRRAGRGDDQGRRIEFGAQIADFVTVSISGVACRFGQSTAQPMTACKQLRPSQGPFAVARTPRPEIDGIRLVTRTG